MPTLSKQDAVNMQNRVNSKKGSGLCFKGSIATIKAKDKGKPKPKGKDALEGLKSNNWIGSEDDFQIAVAKLLDSHNLDWFHCPNGGKRNAREGVKFKKMGVKSGVPDIVIISNTGNFFDDVGLCIELKVGKNTPTDSQEEWKNKFLSNKWAYGIAYGIDDVKELLKENYGI